LARNDRILIDASVAPSAESGKSSAGHAWREAKSGAGVITGGGLAEDMLAKDFGASHDTVPQAT
jgi:hypothetical protein